MKSKQQIINFFFFAGFPFYFFREKFIEQTVIHKINSSKLFLKKLHVIYKRPFLLALDSLEINEFDM